MRTIIAEFSDGTVMRFEIDDDWACYIDQANPNRLIVRDRFTGDEQKGRSGKFYLNLPGVVSIRDAAIVCSVISLNNDGTETWVPDTTGETVRESKRIKAVATAVKGRQVLTVTGTLNGQPITFPVIQSQ